MLDLKSHRWEQLDHAYGSARGIPDLLEDLKTAPPRKKGDWRSEPWFSLWSALCHQFDVYTASYAALPHLVAIAASKPLRERIHFVHLIAWIEICRNRGRAPLIPGDLMDAYDAALIHAAKLVLDCLRLKWDVDDYRVLLGGLAALRHKPSLGASIMSPPEEVECPECGTYFSPPLHSLFDVTEAIDKLSGKS